MLLVAPTWKSQAWYSVLLSMCIPNPFLLPHWKYLLLDPLGKNSSFSSKPNSKTGGLVGFRKSLASKGISDKAAKLISDSRRGSLISSYESARCQWAGWCGKQEIDPFLICLKRGWPIEQSMYIDLQYRLIMNHYMDSLPVSHRWSVVFKWCI